MTENENNNGNDNKDKTEEFQQILGALKDKAQEILNGNVEVEVEIETDAKPGKKSRKKK